MINIRTLTDKDRGRFVRLGDELGRLVKWSPEYLYVVFRCAKQWHRYLEFSPHMVSPVDVEFCDELPIEKTVGWERQPSHI